MKVASQFNPCRDSYDVCVGGVVSVVVVLIDCSVGVLG